MKKNIVISIILISITIVLAIFMNRNSMGPGSEIQYSSNMTLRELAKNNGFPVKEILHIMSHEDRRVWDLPRNIPMNELNIDIESIEHVLEYISEKSNPVIGIVKYMLWAIWISIVTIFILSRKHIKNLRKVLLVLTIIIFGIMLGASPNPMESIIKLFKMINNMEGEPRVIIVSFILFSLFSIVGSKLICGWGCQLGALQETIFNIPVFKKKYKYQVPFIYSISIRLFLLVVFLCVLFGPGRGVVYGIKNYVIYHNIDYFKIFNFRSLAIFALYTLPILVVSSLLIYRPFCQFICPFGLYSWFLENIAINRIRIIEDKCTHCLECVKSCPTQAMKGIYEKKRKRFLPDCWSCGTCIEVCPENAIEYSNSKKIFLNT